MAPPRCETTLGIGRDFCDTCAEDNNNVVILEKELQYFILLSYHTSK